MERITLNVEKIFCEECSLALRRFIGNMDGVESIDVEEGKIAGGGMKCDQKGEMKQQGMIDKGILCKKNIGHNET